MDVDDLDDATLVAGAPRSGKTRFALDMLVAAMKRHGDAYAVMTVSGRQVADRLANCPRSRRHAPSPPCQPSRSAS